MSGRAPIEYRSLSSIKGPLLCVEAVQGVGWDETVEIRLDTGEVRHGVVLEVDRELAVVEVFEGTSGLALDGVRVSFGGSPMRIPVGESWLGRVCNGRGEPLDGGPPILGCDLRTIGGWPINPAARATPSEPILTGVSVIDGLAMLVRGQSSFAVVFAAMGVTNADAAATRERLEARATMSDLVLLVNTAGDPLVERMTTPRLALTVAVTCSS